MTAGQARKQLEKVRQNKSPGPDQVNPRVLKTCAAQLTGVLHLIFNLSLKLEKIPVLWKTSCIVPVPKRPVPSSLNDFRPVALTSHVMKVFERLILAQLRPIVSSALDPLQFAYQAQLSVDDAVIYLLQRAHSHLDSVKGSVRIMFFDFSSAFHTIQPFLMSDKLLGMGVSSATVSWITDYLSGRPQYVPLGDTLSDTVVSNVGAPQGTVLSPFLFTLYTSDFQYSSGSCHLQHDSAVVGCIRDGQEMEYRTLIADFVEWSQANHLLLNVDKTKELVIDFRRKRTPVEPITIQGSEVEIVDCYKYLGVHVNSRLDWRDNCNAVYKKGMSRLYFLRKLRSFNVCSKLLEIFNQSVVSSALYLAVACWGSSTSKRDISRIDKLIRKAGQVVGCQLETFVTVRERRTLDKLLSIMDNPAHPLHRTVEGQRSSFSNRLLQLRCHSERYKNTFIPFSIQLYNNSTLCDR